VVEIGAQRLLDREPRAEAIECLGAPLLPRRVGGRGDPYPHRPQRQIVLGLQRGDGALDPAGIDAHQPGHQILLVPAPEQLGVGVRPDERGGLGRRGARQA
jgi:hypothetical protein